MSNSIKKEEPLRRPGINAACATEPLLHVLPVLGLQSGEEHTESVLQKDMGSDPGACQEACVCSPGAWVHKQRVHKAFTQGLCEEHGLGW